MKKMNLTKWLSLTLCLLLTLWILVGCGAKSAGDSMESVTMNNASGTYMPGSGSDIDKSEIGESVQDAPKAEYEVKIIRTASLSAETQNFDDAVPEIETAIANLGGYVEASEIRERSYAAKAGNYGSRYATFTIRIPAEQLDEFLNTTGELLNVTSSSTSATDISNEYYDIEARLSVLETERAVLENMLAESTSMSNMITVEERLYDVIYEIESYKTMLKVYDSKVSYSTVTLNLSEVTDLTVVAEGNTFGARFKKAVADSWQNFVDFCKDAVIWLVYALPTLIILAVLLTVGILVLVRVSKKRRTNKKADAEKKEDESV